MNSISIKELRTMLPTVRGQLKKGETFLIIYKSRPIAMLKPVDGLPTQEELDDNEFEAVALSEFEDEDDFLSEAEVKHYLLLKSPKIR